MQHYFGNVKLLKDPAHTLWKMVLGFFACNHHRAALYFAETINTPKGFWGWPCPSFVQYLMGNCPPRDPQIIMGEHISRAARGVYLVITESVAPYAIGKYDGPEIEILLKSEKDRTDIIDKYKKQVIQYLDEDSLVEQLYSGNGQNQLHTEFVDNIFDVTLNVSNIVNSLVQKAMLGYTQLRKIWEIYDRDNIH
ncbi:hypothetical protein NQ318_016627 [Aromia moschata]|uniref:Lipase domain-containing protein n=1 Tax=Aromia moschata TaxID=1265417 RepID=A0AAV8X9W4_9CUCU|nr:hypothetical protein NQ318_016627 [Aromia moschata]